MDLFKRIENIIKSNINHKEDDIDIDISSYEDVYYEDAKIIPDEDNRLEKKYYKILELEYGSDFDSIKKSYKKLLKKYHPDLFQNKPEKLKVAQEVTRQLNEAYTYFERKFL